MDSLITIFKFTKRRPELFIGKRSITLLYMYYSGFRRALYENNIEQRSYGKVIEFTEWAAKRYNDINSHNWSGIILEQADGDEAKGLDMFYELFPIYAKEILGVDLDEE